eukprot:m.14946 g.14946  ORF g.14946 m.14946 type:complete len:166 (+) comp6462_c0_seq1:55-552(+)
MPASKDSVKCYVCKVPDVSKVAFNTLPFPQQQSTLPFGSSPFGEIDGFKAAIRNDEDSTLSIEIVREQEVVRTVVCASKADTILRLNGSGSFLFRIKDSESVIGTIEQVPPVSPFTLDGLTLQPSTQPLPQFPQPQLGLPPFGASADLPPPPVAVVPVSKPTQST